MRTRNTLILAGFCATFGVACAANRIHAEHAPAGKEYHVSINGEDTNDGSASTPLRTISAAARLAQPGDVIAVHEGVYRERINPPRGGTSEDNRIIYRAAPGEKVVIKGSEVVKGWQKVQHDAWKVTLANTFFGDFNPFKDVIRGDWFNPRGRVHHTGAVYLNGHWLTEAAKQEDVLQPAGDNPLWFGQVDETSTTILAQFKGVDPNKENVEVNVRQTVFYPGKPGKNFITVRGFTMEHAATPWAPPTAEQIGLIGTHWSKGWIIESNTIRYSTCTGVTLGKYGDEWDNRSQSADAYNRTIRRALKNGWSKERIGGHIVRNNHISHCEQSGIVGSLGPVFCTVTGNTIHDIHVRRLFTGAEMAGIKFHAAIDTVISRNHIYRSGSFAVWLDWMAQGTRVTGNLFHDNRGPDLFVEVNHGPFLVDNNIFLSGTSVSDWSQGGAYVHNLFTGAFALRPQGRHTPFHKAHSTEVAGLHNIPGGDDRYYNNIFLNTGLVTYDGAKLPVFMAGNVFLSGAKPSKHEPSPLVQPDINPGLRLVEKPDGMYLQITLDRDWAKQPRKMVTTELLGKAKIPDLPYEQPDGSPYRIDTDYFGRDRNDTNPFPGPFEPSKTDKQELKIWPEVNVTRRHSRRVIQTFFRQI